MSATIHQFAHRRGEPMTLSQFMASLGLIESTIDWLSRNHVSVIGFGCTRNGPVITVAPHPSVYIAGKGEAERIGYRQIGALRHELWSFKARGDVVVCWEEVVCVH